MQQKHSEEIMLEKYREEKSDMKKMIEEEMAALMEKEKEHVEIAQGTKEKLLNVCTINRLRINLQLINVSSSNPLPLLFLIRN